MAKKRKRDAGLNLRNKHFSPFKSHIEKCEDGVRIMLKDVNVEENNIQNSPSKEKTIEKIFFTCKKR